MSDNGNPIMEGIDTAVTDKVTGWGKSVLTSLESHAPKFLQNYAKNFESHPNPQQDEVNAQNRVKMLSPANPESFANTKRQAEVHDAQQLIDPFKAPTPNLKLIALGAKLTRGYNSPEYKALTPEQQIEVRGKLYDSLVRPILLQNGVNPPDKEQWLARQANPDETTKLNQKAPSSMLGNFYAGAMDAEGFTLNVLGGAMQKVGSYATTDEGKATAGYKKWEEAAQRVRDFGNNIAHVSTDYSSVFDTSGIIDQGMNAAGEMLGSAPAFLAADAFVGPAVETGAEVAKGIVPSLAERAALSTGFKVGVNFLKGAGSIYSIEKMADVPSAEHDAVKYGLIGAGIGMLVDHALYLKARRAARFKAAQEAVGGKPLRNKIETLADEADDDDDKGDPVAKAANADVISVEKTRKASKTSIAAQEDRPDPDHSTQAHPMSSVSRNDPILKEAVKNEQAMRETIARQFHPEKAEAAGDKSIWRNLSKGQRKAITEYISKLGDVAKENMPIVAPEIQVQANAKILQDAVKDDPQFGARLAAMEKLTGRKGEQTLTEMEARQKAAKMGLTDPTRIIKEAQEEVSDEDEAKFEGRSASLKPDYSVPMRAPTSLINPVKAGITPQQFIENTIKYLPEDSHTPSGHLWYENPEHHLLAIAYGEDVPSVIKGKARSILREDFHQSNAVNARRAAWLKNHVTQLKYTWDHKVGQDHGLIYRTTKNTQRRYATPTQRKLIEEDVPETAMKVVANLTRHNPALRASLKASAVELSKNAAKGANPKTESLRFLTLKRAYEILRGEK